jgi:hypothetical protein
MAHIDTAERAAVEHRRTVISELDSKIAWTI